MASRSTQLPVARGFDTALGYFHSSNNYYDSTRDQGCGDEIHTDLWDGHAPSTLNGTDYEELLFRDRAVASRRPPRRVAAPDPRPTTWIVRQSNAHA